MNDAGEFNIEHYALEDALPYLLNRAGVRIGEAFSTELAKFSLTLPMWRVLASLLSHDGQRMSGLAEHTSIDISTLSRLVAVLEKKRLVSRRQAEDDRRSVQVFLSAKGNDLAQRIAPLADLYERVALAGIPPDEVAMIKRHLRQIFNNISSLGVPGGR